MSGTVYDVIPFAVHESDIKENEEMLKLPMRMHAIASRSFIEKAGNIIPRLITLSASQRETLRLSDVSVDFCAGLDDDLTECWCSCEFEVPREWADRSAKAKWLERFCLGIYEPGPNSAPEYFEASWDSDKRSYRWIALKH